jgi:hypothetical protein
MITCFLTRNLSEWKTVRISRLNTDARNVYGLPIFSEIWRDYNSYHAPNLWGNHFESAFGDGLYWQNNFSINTAAQRKSKRSRTDMPRSCISSSLAINNHPPPPTTPTTLHMISNLLFAIVQSFGRVIETSLNKPLILIRICRLVAPDGRWAASGKRNLK